jgi:hypothetical protein
MVNQQFSCGKAKDNLFLDDGLWTRQRQIRSPFDYPWVERQRPSSGLRIRFDAKQLRDLGWLKATWPRLVQQAGQGELLLKPMLGHRSGQAETWYWLKGQLSLR